MPRSLADFTGTTRVPSIDSSVTDADVDLTRTAEVHFYRSLVICDFFILLELYYADVLIGRITGLARPPVRLSVRPLRTSNSKTKGV